MPLRSSDRLLLRGSTAVLSFVCADSFTTIPRGLSVHPFVARYDVQTQRPLPTPCSFQGTVTVSLWAAQHYCKSRFCVSVVDTYVVLAPICFGLPIPRAFHCHPPKPWCLRVASPYGRHGWFCLSGFFFCCCSCCCRKVAWVPRWVQVGQDVVAKHIILSTKDGQSNLS